MKKVITTVALMLALIACTKSSIPKELPESLQSIVAANSNCTCEPYIKAYKWKGQIVYLLGYTGPACNWTPAYFDEEGNTITMASNYPLAYFLEEAEFMRLMWKC